MLHHQPSPKRRRTKSSFKHSGAYVLNYAIIFLTQHLIASQRYIRLRLHGTRLSPNYIITLRLSANEMGKQPRAPIHKRRRPASNSVPAPKLALSSTDSESDIDTTTPLTLSRPRQKRKLIARSRRPGTDDAIESAEADDAALASEAEDESEAALIRANNAYTGATNSIGSIHQRHWFLTLDRPNSGFISKGGKWERSSNDPGGGFETFYVQGAEVERSVVTGRLSAEVMSDEGVEGFRARKMWRAVME